VASSLLLLAELEGLAALKADLALGLALLALKAEGHLLGGLGLLVEDRLGLTTVTLLLSVVSSLACKSRKSIFIFVM